MQGPTNETFIPTKYVINGRVVGGTMRRRNGIRTMPVPARAETPALPPPSHPPPPLEEEDLPPAKKPRLQARTSSSTTADGVTTDSADETPTHSVTPAVSLPSDATSSAPRISWTPEQDAKLIEGVEKHGKKWVAVATLVPGRTNDQCRERWINTVDPANGKSEGKWTPEEDAKLTEGVEKHGKACWVTVAAMVTGRTNDQCRQRWVYKVDPTNEKGKWKPEEDAKLTAAVEKHGNEWTAVADMVTGRTNQQCRQRWTRNLDPANGNKGKWKPEEDAKLIEGVEKHGNEWGSVAAMVSGRTNEQCRNRWVYKVDPNNQKSAGKWKPEEDAELTVAVHKHGKNWVTVAALVTGRTEKQCRSRWVGTLDPNGMKGKWKPEEDAKLTEAVKNHGKEWGSVAAMVPGRTNQQCRNRWVERLDPDRASNTVSWRRTCMEPWPF
jgi:hypothetical protein